MRALLGPVAALMVIGAAWGATQPLAKVAVSQGHAPLGLLVWQSAIVALLLGSLTLIRGRRIPCDRASLGLYLVIALAGSALPGIASYSAAVHLPSGILSILLSSIPMLALPMAIAMGNDRFSAGRLAGLVLGLCGVALLVLPETSLPEGTEALWIPVALVSSSQLENALSGSGPCHGRTSSRVTRDSSRLIRPALVSMEKVRAVSVGSSQAGIVFIYCILRQADCIVVAGTVNPIVPERYPPALHADSGIRRANPTGGRHRAVR